MKSPFYWSFLFSWSIVNWKVFIIIFNPDRFPCENGIQECLATYINAKGAAIYLLWYPILGSFIYILLVPVLDLFASWFKERIVMSIYYSQIKYNPKTLVTGKELERVETELIELRKNRAKESQELTALQNKVNSLTESNVELKEERAKWMADKIDLDDLFQKNHRIMVRGIGDTLGYFDFKLKILQTPTVSMAAKILGSIRFLSATATIHEHQILSYRIDYPQIRIFVRKLNTDGYIYGQISLEKKKGKFEEDIFTGQFTDFDQSLSYTFTVYPSGSLYHKEEVMVIDHKGPHENGGQLT